MKILKIANKSKSTLPNVAELPPAEEVEFILWHLLCYFYNFVTFLWPGVLFLLTPISRHVSNVWRCWTIFEEVISAKDIYTRSLLLKFLRLSAKPSLTDSLIWLAQILLNTIRWRQLVHCLFMILSYYVQKTWVESILYVESIG